MRYTDAPNAVSFMDDFLHLDYDGASFEVDYKCTKCRISLKQINYDGKEEDGYECEGKVMAIERYPCPKCCKNSLYESGTITTLWD